MKKSQTVRKYSQFTRGLDFRIYKEFHKSIKKTQYLIRKTLQRKICEWPKITCKKLNITGHRENANYNHNDISLHTHQNG